MGLAFTVLGSGSGGNCTVLTASEDAALCESVLIDCGFSPRGTSKRMATHGITLDTVRAIVITHFDGDHFQSGWLRVIERENIPVYLHERHRTRAARLGLTGRHMRLYTSRFDLPNDITVAAEPAAHDQDGSMTFVFERAGARLGWATDLGAVHAELEARFVNLDALAIESNYDRQMQLSSGRPRFLVERVMGRRGHLSNEQSLRAVCRADEQSSSLAHIVTLHLSRQCNHPDHIRDLYEREAPHLARRLTVTSQFEPSPWISVEAGARQLEMWS